MNVIVVKPETVEEKIRNKITPMYNLAVLVKDYMSDKHVSNEMLNMCNDIVETCIKNCDFLIKLGKKVDENLPENFDINKEL